MSEIRPASASQPGPTPPDSRDPGIDGVSSGETIHEVDRLLAVMDTLRHRCPWDTRQTHRSLVPYLIEETCEVVEAIEAHDSATDRQPGEWENAETGQTADSPSADPTHHEHLQEELGDLLFQVIFHSAIAQEMRDGFDLSDVARTVADKLIARHPDIYAAHATGTSADGVRDQNLGTDEDSWEERKAQEKGRRSVLDGIPEQFSALARANKIITRARARSVPVSLSTDPIDSHQLGQGLIQLVARAQASGLDAEQAARDAVRTLQTQVVQAESGDAASG